MPRHEPLGRPAPNEVLEGMTAKLRRDANGKLVPALPPKPTKPATEAKPEPRDAPEPPRIVPPYGA